MYKFNDCYKGQQGKWAWVGEGMTASDESTREDISKEVT